MAVREGSVVPTLVFVANQRIAAGAELTVDYGSVHGEQQRGASSSAAAASTLPRLGSVVCLCGTSQCRGRLPFDPQ